MNATDRKLDKLSSQMSEVRVAVSRLETLIETSIEQDRKQDVVIEETRKTVSELVVGYRIGKWLGGGALSLLVAAVVRLMIS